MTCQYCDAPAVFRCKAHRRNLCGSKHCAGYHRVAFRPELCHVVDATADTWKTHVLRTVVALAAGFLLLWIVL